MTELEKLKFTKVKRSDLADIWSFVRTVAEQDVEVLRREKRYYQASLTLRARELLRETNEGVFKRLDEM